MSAITEPELTREEKRRLALLLLRIFERHEPLARKLHYKCKKVAKSFS
jgi:hypothetical protein